MTVTTPRATTVAASAALLLTLTAAPAAATPTYDAQRHNKAVTERVSVSNTERQGNAESDSHALDSTGRYVAFSSVATNLVKGDTNRVSDVFLRDRKKGTTTRVSVTSRGVQGDAESGFGVAISDGGRFVAYLTNARNLVGKPASAPEQTNIVVRDVRKRTTEQVNVARNGRPADYSVSWPVAISASGRYVAFVSAASNLAPGTSTGEQVYVRDRQHKTTSRVSLTDGDRPFPDGVSTFDATISADGRYVAFVADGSVQVRDRRRGATATIAEGGQPSLSANGRFVAFQSCAADVVAGDVNGECDAFVRDRRRGTTRLVTVSSSGQQADGGSFAASISPEGRYVAFTSRATNLVAGDTNAGDDVFVRDTRCGRTVRVSVGYQGQAVGSPFEPRSFGGDLSAGGRFVAYRSDATNLVRGDTNGVADVFVTRVREGGRLLPR
jgi:hypothetical protein